VRFLNTIHAKSAMSATRIQCHNRVFSFLFEYNDDTLTSTIYVLFLVVLVDPSLKPWIG